MHVIFVVILPHCAELPRPDNFTTWRGTSRCQMLSGEYLKWGHFIGLHQDKTPSRVLPFQSWACFWCSLFSVRLCVSATWVGGGFIVGTAEAVYNPSMGLTWAVMPITATMCFVIGKISAQNKQRIFCVLAIRSYSMTWIKLRWEEELNLSSPFTIIPDNTGTHVTSSEVRSCAVLFRLGSSISQEKLKLHFSISLMSSYMVCGLPALCNSRLYGSLLEGLLSSIKRGEKNAETGCS